MTTLALITMLVVQITVTSITVWFLIRTMHKTNHQKHQELIKRINSQP